MDSILLVSTKSIYGDKKKRREMENLVKYLKVIIVVEDGILRSLKMPILKFPFNTLDIENILCA